jgi:3-oxoacyl-[acyl-carrier protein] reductase
MSSKASWSILEPMLTNPEQNPVPKETVAVVTGASGGIGRAVALALARQGANVVVHGCRQKQAAEDVAAEIVALGKSASVALANLGHADELAHFCEAAWNWRGGIDVLVHCAGADVLTGEASSWPFEQKLSALWQVDVAATIAITRRLGRQMKDRGQGSIITIGWDQAEQGMAGDSGEMFAAIKGAVMAFTRSLAQSLAPQVRVNCLAPGWIRTAWGDGASDYWQQRAARQALRGRWGTPYDVALAAAFLASPAADFITGQIIPVNGGFRFE